MKKLLAVLFVAGTLVACNNDTDSANAEAAKKTADSLATAKTADSLKMEAEKAKMAADTNMNKMKAVVDTGVNKMKATIDTGVNKMKKP